MRILLTNDDGIHAPGIKAMWRELKKLGEVIVVAPETVQSATGHGITIAQPLLTSEVQGEDGYGGIAVDGRPADCVKVAINQIIEGSVDLVVSGMNSGVNVGINVIYSGTVAAAIEAAFLGLPSIAVSLHLDHNIKTNHARAATWGRETIEKILAAGLNKGEVASINLPAMREGESPLGVKVVRQCIEPWVDTYEERRDPRGRKYYWNSSIYSLGRTQDDTDVAAIREKYITVTPLQFDLTNYLTLKKWEGTF
jgi:5'-nucleotidase